MKKYKRILIVDDNPDVLLAVKLLLQDYFETLETAKNPNVIPSMLQQYDYDAILLDMNFSAGVNTGNEGLFWMQEILKHNPNASIVFLTAYAEIEKAVEAMRKGAFDYIEKPWDDDKLIASLIKAAGYSKTKREVEKLKSNQNHLRNEVYKNTQMIKGKSAAMEPIYRYVEKVAGTDANVLLLGENGTGKDVIAREIHRLSLRKNEMFVNVDLGSIAESLFESEMFGHVKGAFTDAKESKSGRFEIANSGTLFLDEIGNLSLSLQSKLLVALQNREVTPVGGTKKIPIDIRLISATNKTVEQLADNSVFREDLFYRINTITIEIPPLRKRIEDIPVFANIYLEKYKNKYQKPELKISAKAIEKLRNYSWPGNIRELEHSIEKAVILSDNMIIDEDSFFNQSSKVALYTLNLQENEKMLITQALQKHNGVYTNAAEELGITRRTLYNKIRQYGL